MITSPLYWQGLRDKVWLELAFICCMEVRIRGCPTNIFTIAVQDPFPTSVCLKAPLVRQRPKVIGGMFPQMHTKCFLTDKSRVPKYTQCGRRSGVRVKLLISVKSDTVGCIAFDKKKQSKNLYRSVTRLDIENTLQGVNVYIYTKEKKHTNDIWLMRFSVFPNRKCAR